MAKHWKSFVKKEEKSNYKEESDLKTLLSSKEKRSDTTSLEDVAKFNTNLKSLLEEQKQLEDKMAELTGKKEANENYKKYNHEIKTIAQKKKEEKIAAKKKERKKRKENDCLKVDFSAKRKTKKNSILNPPPIAYKKKQKENDFLKTKKAIQATELKITRTQKKVKQTSIALKSNKKAYLNTILSTVKKEKKSVKTLLQPKKKKLSYKIEKGNDKLYSEKKKEKIEFVVKDITKKTKNLIEGAVNKSKKVNSESFIKKLISKNESVNNENFTKEKDNNTLNNKITIVKKATKTYDKFAQTANTLDMGLQKISANINSTEIRSVSKKVTKGIGIINKVSKSINKTETLFNTTNKYLNKTSSTTNFLQKKDTKTDNAFNINFIQSREAKKQENLDFDVSNQKLNVGIYTIKKLTKGIETLHNFKTKKDSFSF